MTEKEKNKIDKTTKIFIISFITIFVLTTLGVLFGEYSYQFKAINNNTNANKNSSKQAVLSAYSEKMHDKISSKWTPPSVRKDARVILEFTIKKNGRVVDERIYESSGNEELDNSALKALKKASPLPPLPLNFNQDSLTVKFDFAVKAATE